MTKTITFDYDDLISFFKQSSTREKRDGLFFLSNDTLYYQWVKLVDGINGEIIKNHRDKIKGVIEE